MNGCLMSFMENTAQIHEWIRKVKVTGSGGNHCLHQSKQGREEKQGGGGEGEGEGEGILWQNIPFCFNVHSSF